MVVADDDPGAAGSTAFVRSDAGSAEMAPRVTCTQPSSPMNRHPVSW